MASNHSPALKHGAALFLFVTLFIGQTAAVSDSDMCFIQPIDQCQGNQFVELGSTDADTDGNPYSFEADITNANQGEAVLQYKDSSTTSFSDIYTSTFFDDFGSSNSVFWQDVGSVTVDEFGSQTITIDGSEVTIDTDEVDVGASTAETIVDADNLGALNAGETFTAQGQTVQLSETSTGQEVDQSGTTADGEWYNFTTGGTQHNVFLDSVVDSNTVAAEIDGNFDNYNQGYTESLGGGYTLELTDVISLGSGDGEADWTVYQDVDQASYTVFSDVTAPEDYNEYRVKWVENGNPQAWSDSLFFSVDLGQNIPADQSVRINNDEINQPRTLTEVTPNSNINLTVFQGQEQDPVNVTLLTSGGTEVATISQGDNYGAFRAIYDDFSDSLLSSFRGGSNDTYVFPTLESNLLSQQGTTYDFYFEITDKGESGNPTRTTKMYTVETSGTATNQPPNISSVEVVTVSQPTNWEPVENVSFGDRIDSVRAEINDPDNEFLTAELYLEQQYDNEIFFNNASYDSNVGDTYTWDVNGSIEVDDSGDWTAQVYADDGSNNVSEERSWSFPFTEPKISIDAPEFVAGNQYFYPRVSFWCPQYECVNQNETVNRYLDPVRSEVFY